jgi:hypothetical protein
MLLQQIIGLTIVALLLAGGVEPRLALALEIGEKAPEFTLPSTTGEKISLSQFRGRSSCSLNFTAPTTRRSERRTSRPGRPTLASSRH